MTTQPAARRRWPWYVLGIAVFVIVVVVGLVIFTPRGGSPEATPHPTAPSTSSTTAPPAVEGVDGCLAGDARSPQTVIDAQKEAPQTPEGAVSFVATFARWIAQKPAVPADELAQIDGKASTMPNLAGSAASFANAEVAQFHTSTINGYYRIESVSDDVSRVAVTVMLPLVINDAVDPTLRFTPSVAVEWSDAGWVVVEDLDTTGTDSLPTTGTPIPGGC